MKMRKNLTKSICLLVALVLLCTCLTACDSSNYSKAEELYNGGEYAAALELYNALGEYEDSTAKAKMCQYAIANEYFENAQYEDALAIYKELGEYEDSSEKAAFCEKEIGMTTNADYDFLAALEKSVSERMAKPDDADRSILVNTEFAYLGKFENATFYDDTIKELSALYLKGLHEQEEALKSEIQSDYQVAWQQGIVHRYEALKRLYEEYEFMADNMDFVGTYVMKYDSQKGLLDAYIAIEADISAQTSVEDLPIDFKFSNKQGTMSYTLVNNTAYTFSTVFEYTFLSDDGTIFYNSNAYIENIKPGNSYVVSIYIDGKNCKTNNFNWEWNNYYTDVQLP